MGEVYKARDRRLDRTVAIKVLPEHVATNPDLKQRFEREAKTLAVLSHPHICQVFDVGHENGVDFLVMEYLEGETLAQRLTKGALPLENALQVAVQIADALDKAHREGVVHRDLKPGNIMLTKSGAKLLDFGLAKVAPVVTVDSAGAISHLQTLSAPLTSAGSVLGTLQYMAPEQVEGRDVDHRSDVWAFGTVLYEMLTGRRAFDGGSAASVMSTILLAEPAALVPQTGELPLHLIVGKCLAKDPDSRWNSLGDVAEMLKWIRDDSLSATSRLRGNSPRRRLLIGTVVAIFAGVMIGGGILVGRLFTDARDVSGPLTLTVTAPPSTTGHGALALSPDGRYIALQALDEKSKVARLWLRPLDSAVWRPLPETDGAESPFWAPDSRFLAFVADNKLRKIDVLGGPPQTIVEKATRWGATWGVDGTLLFNESGNGPLSRVSAAGGTTGIATALEPGEVRHQMPHFLPDGQHFLYGSFPSNIYVGSVRSTERKLLLRDVGLRTAYSGGHLFFERAGTLMAQQFDVTRLELVGDPYPVATVQDSASFDVTTNGLLAFKAGGGQRSHLQWLDRAGKSLGVVGDAANYYTIELSPDDRQAAGSMLRDSDRRSFLGDVWIYEFTKNSATRLTFDPSTTVGRSVWAPDGHRIVFMRRGDKGVLNLFEKSSDGNGDERALLEDGVNKYPLSWSRDGRFLLYMAVPGSPTTGSDLWVLPLFGERKPFPFLQTRFREIAGQFSPDGRWIAYLSDFSGRPEVHVASFPDARIRRQISSGGRGGWPRWRGDGKELFWLFGNEVIAASVENGGNRFDIGAIQTLFTVNPSGDSDSSFAVSADGQRFLIISSLDADPSTITLMTNVSARLNATGGSRPLVPSN
jgi:serine/threonine protein kinase